MKCSKTINQLSGSERKRLMNEIQKANHEFLEEKCKEMRVRITNNLFKLFVIASNEAVGLGTKRIERILQELNKRVIESENKEESWLLFDEECKQVLGKETYYKYFTDTEMKL